MDDLISRQAAIDALHMHLMYRMGTDSNKKRLDDWINGLPSAQPQRKTATWVKTEIGWKCSNCTLCTNIKGKTEFNYCPNCGYIIKPYGGESE